MGINLIWGIHYISQSACPDRARAERDASISASACELKCGKVVTRVWIEIFVPWVMVEKGM
jgi:hypothetical protein